MIPRAMLGFQSRFHGFVAISVWLAWSTPLFARDVDYGRDVRPILSEHCIQCHGPDKAEGGLDLSHQETATTRLDSGQYAILGGKPRESQLLLRVASPDPDMRMPPGDAKALTSQEVVTLERWIREGAAFDQHWSFRKLSRPTIPNASLDAAGKNPIDAYVVSALDAQGIQPSSEASAHHLIRRLHLDLVGLLPTQEVTQQFVKDHTDAPEIQEAVYERLVDRLLASPRFGERWGRHWLDLARYADSDGYEKDRPREDAFVYRDWVIRAFNQGMPFDQFTIEQLAGDLLPDATPNQWIATAFQRQTLTNTEGGVDQEEYRVAANFDRTDTVGSIWLGLTLGCAKCHSHKFDPISHVDYYQMFAFFNESEEFVQKLPIGLEDSAGFVQAWLPLHQALQQRFRAIYPEQQRWETQQRERVERAESQPLMVEQAPLSLSAHSQNGLTFQTQDGAIAVTHTGDDESDWPETDLYTIYLKDLPEGLTGFRIETMPNPSFNKSGAGLAAGGNFVITSIHADIVSPEGSVIRDLPFQRPEADFEQSGFKAAHTLDGKRNAKQGWAVSPKVDQPHWLQVRTMAPITLAEGESVRLSLDQSYGERHLLGRFRIRALTGDERDLHLTKDVVNALKMYPEKRLFETRQTLFQFYVKDDSVVRKLQSDMSEVEKESPSRVMPIRVLSDAWVTRTTHRFERGDFLTPAEPVSAGTLSALPPLPGSDPPKSRLDLARWLISPDNPLTPRVMANQIWSRLFGAGLVRSINDFGVRGDHPSHPELLDWLAITLRDDMQWDTKAFIKQIVMSRTYRQSSRHRPDVQATDPANRWLSRQNRVRVEAELVRDLALQVSGLLSNKIGGPSVFPSMPPELAQLSYANNFTWTESQGEDRYRRGMYTFFKRTVPHPTLMTFDCPDTNSSCVQRGVSNTPLQALTLLNNETFVEAAQALATIAVSSGPDDLQRVGWLMETCLTRSLQEGEQHRMINLLDQARNYYQQHPDQAKLLVGDRVLPVPQPGAVQPNDARSELAAWIATVRVLINLDEFITRE